MYQLYYNVSKKKYDDKIRLLGTDTDSLIVYIDIEDVHKDIKEDTGHDNTFDHKIEWMPQKNKNVPGLFKNEYLGIPICEYLD